MRVGRLCVQIDSVAVSSDSPVVSSGARGTTSARSFAFGASTPWIAQRGSAHFAKRSYADTKADQVQPGPWHGRLKGALRSPVLPGAA